MTRLFFFPAQEKIPAGRQKFLSKFQQPHTRFLNKSVTIVFPLLKLDQVIDWQPIEQYLNRQRTRYLRDHRGRPAYPLLSMFKAVLLGQWHSLSDPELEHSLITRIDFNLFCRFDELSIPDYSTLCRYRNRRRKTTPCPNCWN